MGTSTIAADRIEVMYRQVRSQQKIIHSSAPVVPTNSSGFLPFATPNFSIQIVNKKSWRIRSPINPTPNWSFFFQNRHVKTHPKRPDFCSSQEAESKVFPTASWQSSHPWRRAPMYVYIHTASVYFQHEYVHCVFK